MKNPIIAIVCSLFLLVYPMFVMGFFLDQLTSSNSLAALAVVASCLAVGAGIFWNIWILVSLQLEKESLESRMIALSKKGSESQPQPPVAPFPSRSQGLRVRNRNRFVDSTPVQGFKPS